MNLFTASPYPAHWVILLAVVLAAIAFWLYRSELRKRNASTYAAILLPLLRSLAVALVVLMLLEPSLALRHIQGRPNELVIAIDDSASMTRADENGKTRWQTAIDLISNQDRLSLKRLADHFDVRLIRTNGVNEKVLWSADSSSVEKPTTPGQQELSISLTPVSNTQTPSEESTATELPMRSAMGNLFTKHPDSVMLMLSDGVSTEGASIAAAAQLRATDAPSLFFIGLGAQSDLIDAKLLSISAPQQVDQLDSVAGELRFEADPKLPARVAIRFRDKIVWSASLSDEQLTQQRVAFSFPIKPLLDSLQGGSGSDVNLSQRSGLLSFTATLEQSTEDIEPRNNTADFHTWVSLLRNRVLLADGRPRWETRYIRNALERDPTWEVTAISTAEQTGKEELQTILSNTARLAEFDLVILGELGIDSLPASIQKELRHYVSDLGGGLIVIDGRLGYYRQKEMAELSELLPVEFKEDAADQSKLSPLYQATPTAAAKDQPTFMISSEENSETFDWKSLPSFYVQTMIHAKPAATVLMNGIDPANNQIPIFVETRAGAGMVFYSSTDQTWKWRYLRADAVHRRMWAQICRSYSRKPFLVHTPSIDLDVNAKIFRDSDTIPIRVRLNDDQFSSQEDRMVYAIITNDQTGQSQRYQLQADPTIKAQYQGTVPALPSGQYTFRLETAGMTALQQAVSARIVVADQSRSELLATYQDRAVMEQAASGSGGGYYRPAQTAELMDALIAQSTGRVIRDNYALWKSYWWFVPLIALLGCEWLLRKRSGLI